MINSFFLSLIKSTVIQKLKIQGGVVPAPLVVAVHSFFDLFHDSDKLDLVQTPDQQFSSLEVRHYSWGEVFIYIIILLALSTK